MHSFPEEQRTVKAQVDKGISACTTTSQGCSQVCCEPLSLGNYMTKQKYDAQEEFWFMMQMGDCSLNWKVLCARVDVIEVDLEWEVGDGAFIDAINDKWINGKSLMDLQMLENQEMLLPSTAVADMMVDKEWDNRALEQ